MSALTNDLRLSHGETDAFLLEVVHLTALTNPRVAQQEFEGCFASWLHLISAQT